MRREPFRNLMLEEPIKYKWDSTDSSHNRSLLRAMFLTHCSRNIGQNTEQNRHKFCSCEEDSIEGRTTFHKLLQVNGVFK